MQDINNKLAAIVDLLTKMFAAQGKTNELLYTIIDKLDGFKVVATKAGTKAFEMDALDVTYPNILYEMCAAVPTDFAWNDLHSQLEETGEKPDDEEPDAAQKEEVDNA